MGRQKKTTKVTGATVADDEVLTSSDESSVAFKKAVALAPDPADVDYDPPLIQCLAGLFKIHGKPVSTRLLVAGLPKVSGPLHPQPVSEPQKLRGCRPR